MIEDVFVVIGDFLDKLIIDRAFNKNKSLIKRIPFIIIYYLLVLGMLFLSVFIGINYILTIDHFLII